MGVYKLKIRPLLRRILITGFPVAMMLLLCSCSGLVQQVPGISMCFLDHPELLGTLDSETDSQSTEWEIADIKLGTLVHRAVEFPSGGIITCNLPDIRPGTLFTCSIGIDMESETIPAFGYRIYALTPDGTEVSLAEGETESGSSVDWHPIDVELVENTTRDVDLCIELTVRPDNATVYLANPRLDLPGSQKPRQVIIVCIDTLRADVLGCYGNNLGITPRLDALAERAVRFEKCEAPGSWTFPSVSATMTGRYSGYIIPSRGTRYIRPDVVTLAELFYSEGFRTATVTSNVHPTMEFGFFQGYEYSNEFVGVKAEELVQDVIEWIEARKDQDFFVYLHLNDPHHPFTPPEPFLSRFRRGNGRFESDFSVAVWNREKNTGFPQGEREQVKSLWEGEVAYTDQQVGVLIDSLRELNIWRDLAFITYGDHGEEFWELDHGGFGHAHTVYEELTHVPLLMKIPGQGTGVVREDRISLIDLVPTLGAWAGLDLPDDLPGMDVFTHDYDRNGSRIIFTERGSKVLTGVSGEINGCILGDWKGIIYFDGISEPELFNLAEDPEEQNNLFDVETDLAESVFGELLTYSAQTDEGTHVVIYPSPQTNGKVYRVTLSMADGVINNPTPFAYKGDIQDERIEDSYVEYSCMMDYEEGKRPAEFSLTFFPEPETAEFRITVEVVGMPSFQLPWTIGGTTEVTWPVELVLSTLDPSIALSYPRTSMPEREGVYVWSVPPSLTRFEHNLSPETLEELAALGYIQ